MNSRAPFWERPLAELDRGEWEALCDGCGRCCVHKLEAEETGLLFPTTVACKLLGPRPGTPPPPAAGRWRAAARLALFGRRQPRNGARGGAIDARLGRERGRRG